MGKKNKQKRETKKKEQRRREAHLQQALAPFRPMLDELSELEDDLEDAGATGEMLQTLDALNHRFPGQPEVLRKLLEVALELEQHGPAADAAEQLLALRPTPELEVSLGAARLQLGHFALAEEALRG